MSEIDEDVRKEAVETARRLKARGLNGDYSVDLLEVAILARGVLLLDNAWQRSDNEARAMRRVAHNTEAELSPPSETPGKPPEWAHEDFIRDVPDSDTRLEELLGRLMWMVEVRPGKKVPYLQIKDIVPALRSLFAQQEARIRELTEKVEQTQAAFQASRNHYEPLVASLSSQIERLKADSTARTGTPASNLRSAL